MHLLLHILGVDDMSGKWYGFWSGIGSDLGLIATPLVLLRKHNCHTRRCWRIGRHPVAGTTWTVCRKHHPDDHPTAQDITAGSGQASDAAQKEGAQR